MDIVLNHKSGKRLACRGFTLLEVMVALAVLAIALTSIYRLQGQTMTMSAAARFYSLAPQLARAKISEIERQDYKTITGGDGDFGEDYPGYSWNLALEDQPSDLVTNDKYHLAVFNLTIKQNEENSYQLRTYRFFTDK